MYDKIEEEESSYGLDFGGFHSSAGCDCYVIPADGHTHGFIYCRSCKVGADLEAISEKITHTSAKFKREKEAKT